jgi:hypothetical protein
MSRSQVAKAAAARVRGRKLDTPAPKKKRSDKAPVLIEDIESLRRQHGIVDVELHRSVCNLNTGDLVRLTFLAPGATFPGETLLVRIASSQGHQFRGTLAQRPRSSQLVRLRLGASLVFDAGQIHSIPDAETAQDD